MFWLLIILGVCWWVLAEYIRSKPKCPSNIAFLFSFAGPLGCVAFVVSAFLEK